MKHGNGLNTYLNGDYYDGEWANDQQNGHGVYITKEGVRREGIW